MEAQHLCLICRRSAYASATGSPQAPPTYTHVPEEPQRHIERMSSVAFPKPSKRLSQQDLLQIASQPVAIGRTARLPSGCLQDWPLWAKMHPQSCMPVEVQVAGSMHADEDQVSLVSWNALSKTWLALSELDPEYAHVHQDLLEWKNRSRALIDWMSMLAADMFALQEVDFDTFDECFLQPLAKLGYDGMMQDCPKRADEQPCGNATFWRRDKFELLWSDHLSRALLTELRVKSASTSESLILVNAHLESSQQKFSSRATQVHSALEKAVRRNPRASMILAGDFNTGSDSSLCKVLREYEWHSLPLASAYEHPAAELTSPVVDATFRVNGHGYLIDHIWYRHSHLQLCKLLQPLNANDRCACLGSNAMGLPDKNVPSDHIPLGAIFMIKERVASPTSCSEPTSAEEFWSSSLNVLTIEQRDLWQKLQAMQPQQKRKGRPSEEEFATMRAAAAERKALEQALLAGLDEAGKDFVCRMRAFLKKSSK